MNLGELGTNFLDSAGDILGSFGTNFQANAAANLAAANRTEVNNQIALAKTQAELERKKRFADLMQNVIMAMVVILGIISLSYVGISIYKAKKGKR